MLVKNFFLLFLAICFLTIPIFGLSASQVVEHIDGQLRTGSVIQIIRWDSEKQEVIYFTPGIDEANSENDFEVEPGFAYSILTNVTEPEQVNIPFAEFFQPDLKPGWNLISENVDLSNYDVAQVSIWNPKEQLYDDWIAGFSEGNPKGGAGWVFIRGGKKKVSSVPHSLYGLAMFNDSGIECFLVFINLNTEDRAITKSNSDGKYSINILDIGPWLDDDRILIEAYSDNKTASSFIELDSSVPNQRIDIQLLEEKKEEKPVVVEKKEEKPAEVAEEEEEEEREEEVEEAVEEKEIELLPLVGLAVLVLAVIAVIMIALRKRRK